MEVLARTLIVDGLVHGRDHGWGEGLGDVADAEADDLRLGVGLLVGLDAVGDFGEQVAGLDLQVVFIDADHRWTPFSLERKRSTLYHLGPRVSIDASPRIR